MIAVVMGVSGSGKTTIGKLLGQRLGWPFSDADDFHSQASVEMMRSGHPLADADRLPWLSTLAEQLRVWSESNENVVLACSALKESYRAILSASGADLVWICLHGAPELIAQRIAKRSGHFMPPSLLQTQFDALEVPADAITVDVSETPDRIVERIVEALPKRATAP